jgi:hypothetical protein
LRILPTLELIIMMPLNPVMVRLSNWNSWTIDSLSLCVVAPFISMSQASAGPDLTLTYFMIVLYHHTLAVFTYVNHTDKDYRVIFFLSILFPIWSQLDQRHI